MHRNMRTTHAACGICCKKALWTAQSSLWQYQIDCKLRWMTHHQSHHLWMSMVLQIRCSTAKGSYFPICLCCHVRFVDKLAKHCEPFMKLREECKGFFAMYHRSVPGAKCVLSSNASLWAMRPMTLLWWYFSISLCMHSARVGRHFLLGIITYNHSMSLSAS